MPRSHVEGALVSIGFHNDLRVDAPHVNVDLDDLSPIGPVAMHGKLQTSAQVTGTFHDPQPEGDIQSITGFAVADVQFGDLSSGHVKVDVHGPEVEITGVHAKRRDSAYDVPTATLKFGGTRGFVVDAVGSTGGFGLRDLLSRCSPSTRTPATTASTRASRRGPTCTSPSAAPRTSAAPGTSRSTRRATSPGVGLYGEHFAQGDADVSMRWYDREAGIAGADVDVRSFVLSKVQPASGHAPDGHRNRARLGVDPPRGGALRQRDARGRSALAGRRAGLARRRSSTAASPAWRTSAATSTTSVPTRASSRAPRSTCPGRACATCPFPRRTSSEMTQRFPQQKRVVGHTRCGAPIAPPFDRAAYLADTSSHGEWKVNGELLGDTVQLTDVVATRAKAPRVSGRVALRGLDLGPLARIFGEHKTDADEAVAATSPTAVGGQLWGELVADDIPLDDPAHAR